MLGEQPTLSLGIRVKTLILNRPSATSVATATSVVTATCVVRHYRTLQAFCKVDPGDEVACHNEKEEMNLKVCYNNFVRKSPSHFFSREFLPLYLL